MRKNSSMFTDPSISSTDSDIDTLTLCNSILQSTQNGTSQQELPVDLSQDVKAKKIYAYKAEILSQVGLGPGGYGLAIKNLLTLTNLMLDATTGRVGCIKDTDSLPRTTRNLAKLKEPLEAIQSKLSIFFEDEHNPFQISSFESLCLFLSGNIISSTDFTCDNTGSSITTVTEENAFMAKQINFFSLLEELSELKILFNLLCNQKMNVSGDEANKQGILDSMKTALLFQFPSRVHMRYSTMLSVFEKYFVLANDIDTLYRDQLMYNLGELTQQAKALADDHAEQKSLAPLKATAYYLKYLCEWHTNNSNSKGSVKTGCQSIVNDLNSLIVSLADTYDAVDMKHYDSLSLLFFRYSQLARKPEKSFQNAYNFLKDVKKDREGLALFLLKKADRRLQHESKVVARLTNTLEKAERRVRQLEEGKKAAEKVEEEDNNPGVLKHDSIQILHHGAHSATRDAALAPAVGDADVNAVSRLLAQSTTDVHQHGTAVKTLFEQYPSMQLTEACKNATDGRHKEQQNNQIEQEDNEYWFDDDLIFQPPLLASSVHRYQPLLKQPKLNL